MDNHQRDHAGRIHRDKYGRSDKVNAPENQNREFQDGYRAGMDALGEDAINAKGDIETMGYRAYVVDYQLSIKLGLPETKEQRPILPPQITHSQRQGRMAAPQIIMSRNLKYDEGNGDYAFVEFIERIPSNCIEVRYKRKRRTIELVSYAVYGASNVCYVSHETTERMRKKYGNDLAPLLKLEQQRNPNRPIHVL